MIVESQNYGTLIVNSLNYDITLNFKLHLTEELRCRENYI